jgi:hypothetical protein
MAWRFLPVCMLLALAGCLNDEPNKLIVQPGPFSPAPQVPAIKRSYAPATEEVAKRVLTLGQQIVVANPQIGMRPIFVTIGSPEPEIFHRGQNQVIVTEALAKQCTTDRLLAAVLFLELGKMVSEREAVASVQARQPEHEPPPDARGAGDSSFGPSDQTRLAELARYERTRRPSSAPPPPPPDPRTLAQTYLAKAGFHAADLEAAAPILQQAEANFRLEKQMTSRQADMDAIKKEKPSTQTPVTPAP